MQGSRSESSLSSKYAVRDIGQSFSLAVKAKTGLSLCFVFITK